MSLHVSLISHFLSSILTLEDRRTQLSPTWKALLEKVSTHALSLIHDEYLLFTENIGGPNQSPLGDPTVTGRKDSLSLNVEFVKVNISRSRKGVVVSDFASSSIGSSSARLQQSLHDSKAANHVRVSAVCDIGSASFKYDMRRLSEILCFPKAWYRRKLARRLFLGEETAVQMHSDDEGNVTLVITTQIC